MFVTDQEFESRKVIGPGGVPATTILLSRHSSRVTPNSLQLFPYISALVSPHQFLFALVSSWHKEPQIVNMWTNIQNAQLYKGHL